MSTEHESSPLSSIHLDFKERAISFEAENGRCVRLAFSPGGLLLEILAGDAAAHDTVETLVRTTHSAESKEATVTATGRLKTQPRQGRPDARGKPTAWARLAVHEEGHPEAHLYSATFHRHTASIALSLSKEAQITIQGYPHPANDPTGKRLDTFSVINIVAYPGS